MTRSETTQATSVLCPSCGKPGKHVGLVTMRALLKDEYLRDFPPAEEGCCGTGELGVHIVVRPFDVFLRAILGRARLPPSRVPGSRLGRSLALPSAAASPRYSCEPITPKTGFRFCSSPGCDNVYFSAGGAAIFTRDQLRVAVGIKEATGERPLCYCFKHSVESIKDELRRNGRSEALEDIRAKMKDRGCRCEIENPSGTCCLGDVTKGIQIAQEELRSSEMAHSTPPTKPSSRRNEKIANVGTLVAAIMASSCCWLPLLLLALGVSGAGIASTLEAYRPLFIVVTFGFLGAAFYFTYRPKAAATAAGDSCCGPERAGVEDCCSGDSKGGFRIIAFNKVTLWVVSVLAIAFLLFPNYVGALLGTSEGATASENMNWAVFHVDGMTCEGCAATVAQAIRSVPGVLAVEVSYAKEQATVGSEPCCPVPQERILAALTNAGYGGLIIEDSKSSKTDSN